MKNKENKKENKENKNKRGQGAMPPVGYGATPHVFNLLPLLLILLLSFALPAQAAQPKWQPQNDIERISKEVPSLSSFAGYEGVMWLKEASYSLLADGTLEYRERLLILAGENLPPNWAVQTITAPVGGSVQVEESSWYNQMTGIKEGELALEKQTQDGLDRVRITIPNEAAGRVAAISTVQRSNRRTNIDDVIFLALDLPIWEQKITVNVPGDKPLYWYARKLGEPLKSSDSKGSDSYEWTINNQAPWVGGGLIDDKRPVLAFSLRKGLHSSILEASKLNLNTLEMPDDIKNISISQKRGLVRFAQKINAIPILEDVPWYVIRDNPPSEGPLTHGERTFAAAAWLKKLGAQVNLWQQPIIAADKDAIVTEKMWDRPVLEVIQKGSEPVFYRPGQAAAYGEMSFELSGFELYRIDGQEPISKKIPAMSASENRFLADWRFEMNEYGVGEGTFELTVRGGWAGVMTKDGLPAGAADIEAWLKQNIRFDGPKVSLSNYEITLLPTGFRLHCSAKCTLSITMGSNANMLVRLPATVPARLEEMLSTAAPYTLLYPFVMEQRVFTTIPAGYELMSDISLSKGPLQQKMTFWPKKRELSLQNIWIVKGGETDQTQAKALVDQAVQMLKSLEQGIPLKKR